MSSSFAYGQNNYYEIQRANAAKRLRTGVDSISDDQIYAATQTDVGFIDTLSKVLPRVRK